MHAGAPRLRHPLGQLHVGHCRAGLDVPGDPRRDRLPTRRLPDLERALVPAEAPADRQIEVARVVGDGAEVHRAVMEGVAEYRPHELSLRVAARLELRETLRDAPVLED